MEDKKYSSKKAESLAVDMNSLNFKNSQAMHIMGERAKKRNQSSSRYKRKQAPTPAIAGLSGLGATLQMPAGYRKRK